MEVQESSSEPEVDESRPRLRVGAPRRVDGAGRYRPGALLGRGGMGDVLECEDRHIGRTVAMKVLPRGVEEPETVQRFVREALVQARLEHPSIVPVYDVGTREDGAPFFTMKCVRGVTLGQVIAARRRGDAHAISTRRLLAALATVCHAVDYAHRSRVVHGDLKPDNVMLADFGEVYVLDWGCALDQLDGTPEGTPEGDRDESPERSGERALELVGTPGYMAPEQARGMRGDQRSDLYALGAILFEILTDERLHHGRTPLGRLVRTLETPEQRPSERAPQRAIAPELDALALRSLSADPALRPSAHELATALETYLDREPIPLRESARLEVGGPLALLATERRCA